MNALRLAIALVLMVNAAGPFAYGEIRGSVTPLFSVQPQGTPVPIRLLIQSTHPTRGDLILRAAQGPRILADVRYPRVVLERSSALELSLLLPPLTTFSSRGGVVLLHALFQEESRDDTQPHLVVASHNLQVRADSELSVSLAIIGYNDEAALRDSHETHGGIKLMLENARSGAEHYDITYVPIHMIPSLGLEYCSADVVLVPGSAGRTFTDVQMSALISWVRAGGRMIFVRDTSCGPLDALFVAQDGLDRIHKIGKSVEIELGSAYLSAELADAFLPHVWLALMSCGGTVEGFAVTAPNPVAWSEGRLTSLAGGAGRPSVADSGSEFDEGIRIEDIGDSGVALRRFALRTWSHRGKIETRSALGCWWQVPRRSNEERDPQRGLLLRVEGLSPMEQLLHGDLAAEVTCAGIEIGGPCAPGIDWSSLLRQVNSCSNVSEIEERLKVSAVALPPNAQVFLQSLDIHLMFSSNGGWWRPVISSSDQSDSWVHRVLSGCNYTMRSGPLGRVFPLLCDGTCAVSLRQDDGPRSPYVVILVVWKMNNERIIQRRVVRLSPSRAPTVASEGSDGPRK